MWLLTCVTSEGNFYCHEHYKSTHLPATSVPFQLCPSPLPSTPRLSPIFMYLFISCFVCKHFVPSFKPTSPPPPDISLYCTSLNPLLSPCRAYLFWGPFEGGGEGLFNLEKTVSLVLHKELEYKVEKLKYKKVRSHAAEDQNQIQSSSL